MKNLISFSVLLIALTFSSCQSATSTPEGTVKAFLAATGELNVSEIKKYCTPMMGNIVASTIESLSPEEIQIRKKEFNETYAKMESIECTENGDKAVCKICCDDNGKSEELKLLKENDQWLVNPE